MSRNSKPLTGSHASGSKISETNASDDTFLDDTSSDDTSSDDIEGQYQTPARPGYLKGSGTQPTPRQACTSTLRSVCSLSAQQPWLVVSWLNANTRAPP